METFATGAALKHIGQVLDGVDASARAGLTHTERLDLVKAARIINRRVEALLGVLVAEADAAGSAKQVAGVTTTSWLALDGDLSSKEAAGLVFGGRDVAASPTVRDAALAGEVSLNQARAVKQAMATMPETLPPSKRARAQELLLEKAKTTNAQDLAKLGDQILAEVAPEAVPSGSEESARLALERKRALAARFLRFRRPIAGSVAFEGSLPVLEASQFRSMVERWVEADKRNGREHAADQADPLAFAARTYEQRQADALIALINSRAPHPGNPAQPSNRPTRVDDPNQLFPTTDGPLGAANRLADASHFVDTPWPAPATVMVVMQEDELFYRAEQLGILADGTKTGTPMSAGELRRLCCDANLIPVVLGSQSEILDIGRAERLVTPELRQALTYRDRGCVFPGCNKAAHVCEAHHITPWWSGGSTSLQNLALLCPHHHATVEPRTQHPPNTGRDDPPADPPARQLRWTIHMGSDGRPVVTEPDHVQLSPD